MWNLVLQVINQESSIKHKHVFEEDNLSLMTTKVKCKKVKDATRSIKFDKLDSLRMELERKIT